MTKKGSTINKLLILIVLLIAGFVTFAVINLREIGQYSEPDKSNIIINLEKTRLEEMQRCTVDEDCVYSDNYCCPNTDSKNAVAINKVYHEQYKEMGEPCTENIFCPEIFVAHSGNPTCVNNKCTRS